MSKIDWEIWVEELVEDVAQKSVEEVWDEMVREYVNARSENYERTQIGFNPTHRPREWEDAFVLIRKRGWFAHRGFVLSEIGAREAERRARQLGLL